MKYLYNPATDEFESLAPTLKDRFDLKDQVADASDAVKGTEDAIGLSLKAFKAYQNAGGTESYKDFIASGNEGVSRFFKEGGRVDFELGGGVIQGEKVGGRENFAEPRIISYDDGTFSVRSKYGSTERYSDGTLKPKTYYFNSRTEASSFIKEAQAGPAIDKKVLNNTNSWTEKFFRDNIKKFQVSDYDSFVEKMEKDWTKEIKKNNKKYKGRLKVTISDNDGLPLTQEMEVFGVKSPKKGQVETHGPGVAYYQRAFFKGKLDTDAKLRSGLKEYMQWSLGKGEGQPAAYKADRRDFLNAAKGLDNFDKNVLYFLGEGYDQFKYGQGGASFKNIMDKKFPSIFPKYHKKINLAKGDYFKNLKKVSDLAGVDFNTVVNNIRKENAKVKQILNLDKLPPDMKTGYSGDHLGGIKTAIITNDRNFARKVLSNVVGTTRARNTELGYKLLEQPKNRLVKKYLRAKNTTEKQKIVDDINKLIDTYDSGSQKFKIGKSGKLDFDPLIVQKTPQEKAEGYKKTAKKFFPASTVKKLKEMGVNLFTKLEKGSRTRKQFEALVPGKLDAAVLTPYDFITSIAAGYNIPESSLIAASNLLPRKVQKVLPSIISGYEMQKETTDKFEPVFNLSGGEETKFGKKIRKGVGEAIDKIKDRFGDDSIGIADDVPEPESAERKRMFDDANERFNDMEISDVDDQFMAAAGGRVGFQDGTPDPKFDQILSAFENTDLIEMLEKENEPSLKEEIFGKEGDRSVVQRLYETFNPKAFPYYAAKLTKGLTLAPEFAGRFTLAAPKALAELAQGKKGVGAEFAENIDPKVTQKQVVEKFGLQKIIDDMEENVTGSQKTSGDLFKMIGESVGPATGLGYFASAGKAANQVRKQIQKYAGTASAAKELEKSVEEKAASLQMTRREFNSLLATGGIIGLVKALGLDTLFPAAKQIAKQAAPEIVTKGGTPKYFFDFVSLIKSKGDDVSETASTVERQKVYDYKGYTLTEDVSSGEIKIYKDTEGGGQYTTPDGDLETYDGIMYKEEISYTPKETVLNDKGKPVEVPDIYEESTLKPDMDGDLADVDGGLESIDEILDILSQGGKKYSLDELGEMGINPAGLGKSELKKILKDPTEINRLDGDDMFKDTLNKIKYRSEKAEGGIISGVKSGPPPKSGKTPHGLPYVAKNVRPIKERK